MPSDESSDLPLVTICIPVKNGEGRLEHCLKSVRELEYPADRIEIIVADGLSTDRTVEIARSFGATVLENPHQIVASGRNLAFGAAKGDYIASIDDDCVVPPKWLATAMGLFDDPAIGAVGGPSYLPGEATALAKAANYIFRQASRSGYSVQADHSDEGSADDLPGCNTVYRAEVVREVGLFDESLITAEDVDLNMRIRDLDKKLVASPEFFIWHHKRATVRGLFRQMRRFAVGRVQLGRKRPDALRLLHKLLGWGWAYFLLIAISLVLSMPLWTLIAGLAAVWAGMAGLALLDGEQKGSAVLVPLAFLVVVLGWSTGYLTETFIPMTSTAGQ